ncbi:MAG: GNAT family N-acetyltransferase [Lysobacter sp.]
MSDPATVHVQPVDAAVAARIATLRLAPGQYPYIGEIAFNLADARRDPMSEAMAVMTGDHAIGFYRLDLAPRAVIGRELPAPHLGLRSLWLDRDWQGRGLGTAAVHACCADARRRHPGRHWLALLVDCGNHAAIAAYRRAGFRATGERRAVGSWPQQLMLRRLGLDPTSASSLSQH